MDVELGEPLGCRLVGLKPVAIGVWSQVVAKMSVSSRIFLLQNIYICKILRHLVQV